MLEKELSNSQPSRQPSVLFSVISVKLKMYLRQELFVGINKFRFSSLVKLRSGVLHQWLGVSVMKSWLKAQNPHGRHAGRQTSQRSSFW